MEGAPGRVAVARLCLSAVMRGDDELAALDLGSTAAGFSRIKGM